MAIVLQWDTSGALMRQ